MIIILILVHKALIGLDPKYISDLLTVYDPVRSLRLSDAGLLDVTRIKSKSAEGAFNYFGPDLRKKLPADLESITTVSTLIKITQNISVLKSL